MEDWGGRRVPESFPEEREGFAALFVLDQGFGEQPAGMTACGAWARTCRYMAVALAVSRLVEGVRELLGEDRVVGALLERPLQVRGGPHVLAAAKEHPPQVFVDRRGARVLRQDLLVLARRLRRVARDVQGAGVLHLEARVEAGRLRVLRDRGVPILHAPEGVTVDVVVLRVLRVGGHRGRQADGGALDIARGQQASALLEVGGAGLGGGRGGRQLLRPRGDREERRVRLLERRRLRGVAPSCDPQGEKGERRADGDPVWAQ
jgi:hypothetical protein